MQHMQHFARVFVNFFVGFAVVFATGAGVTYVDPSAGVLLPLGLTALTMPVAVLGLQGCRAVTGLMQMGRLFQMFVFWLLPTLGLALAAWALPVYVTVTSASLAGLVVLAVVTGLNYLTTDMHGMKRSWLPKRWPNGKPPRG
jgi:hypothetical protein